MKRRRAMSLIEVVLAIVILGLAVPPLMIQLGTAAHAQGAAMINMNLVQLAGERVNEVHADRASPKRGYAHVIAANYPDEKDAGGLAGYQRVTTVREVSAADYLTVQPGSGIKRVRVDVTGPDGSTLRVETFVADLPGT
ncbi:MAG: type II secretion system protein [Phycisphaerae bacterium]|jgi:prepilin-type N-terminal cleavage/methylation domain-containing protein